MQNNISKELSEVSDYFISKSGGEIDNKKLQKLVYYAQAWHLVFEKEQLFQEKIEAWVHGPVVRVLFQEYKNFGFSSIDKK